MKKIHFVYSCILMLCVGLLLVSCSEKSGSFKPSDKAIIYEYPGDNIASLKSIIIDEAGSKYTFQFSSDISFTTKSELEKLVSDFTEDKSLIKCAGWVEGTLVNAPVTSVREYTDKESIYISLNLESIDTHVDDIVIGNNEWGFNLSIVDSFDTLVITIYQNGVYSEEKCIDGEMRYTQSYDAASRTWSDIYEKFIPRAAVQ